MICHSTKRVILCRTRTTSWQASAIQRTAERKGVPYKYMFLLFPCTSCGNDIEYLLSGYLMCFSRTPLWVDRFIYLTIYVLLHVVRCCLHSVFACGFRTNIDCCMYCCCSFVCVFLCSPILHFSCL